jgi:hypothetical protein
MAILKERFAVEPGKRDRAIDHLRAGGYEVIEVEDGGAEETRSGALWPVLVVTSAQDVVDSTQETQQAMATAVGELLTQGGFVYRHQPQASPYGDEGGVRRLRRPPGE